MDQALILVIVACAGSVCTPIISPEQSAAAAKEACLLRLDVMLDIAEAMLLENPQTAKANHTFAWNCLPLAAVKQAMAMKLPLPLPHHKIIYHDAEGEGT